MYITREVEKERFFTEEEINMVISNEVIDDEIMGKSVKFVLENAVYCIPLDERSTIKLGESLDFSKAKLLYIRNCEQHDIINVLQQ